MDQYCILIHYHELALKKDNKAWFERIFQRNIQKHISPLPFKNINTYASRVFIYGIDNGKNTLFFFTQTEPKMGVWNPPLRALVRNSPQGTYGGSGGL